MPGDDGIQTLALLKMSGIRRLCRWRRRRTTSCRQRPCPRLPVRTICAVNSRSAWTIAACRSTNGRTETNLLINTAYEMDLSSSTPRGFTASPVPDMPFSPAELERLLRANDVDACSLPDRLWHLVDTFRNEPRGAARRDDRQLRSAVARHPAVAGIAERVRGDRHGSSATHRRYLACCG